MYYFEKVLFGTKKLLAIEFSLLSAEMRFSQKCPPEPEFWRKNGAATSSAANVAPRNRIEAPGPRSAHSGGAKIVHLPQKN